MAIIDRDGATVAAAQTLTEVEWTRSLDAVSTGRAVIRPDGDCCARIGQVRSWRHRLVIYRDSRYVWDGPITEIDWSQESVEIHARDVLAWLDNRVPHSSMRFEDSDLMQIGAWLIADGYAPDDPGHVVEVLGKAGVRGAREYFKNVGQTGDHLRELAEAGIDFTAIGQKILLLPETYLHSVGRLSDVDLPDGLVVSENGSGLVTRWIVAGDEESGALGIAGGRHDYYGLHERYVEAPEIPDSASALESARARLRASSEVPVFVDTQEVTVSPDAAIDVPSLVPGHALDVTSASTCRQVSQRLKIVGLKVTESGGDDDSPGQESVQVQVAASGAEAMF
ncbi:hypothetical protein [Streptomyces sp. AD55]|uniref:hypothetical protein n=1 Tax=Streptomyces sp. AD55 TaxID=3242895 RepID=UPI0035292751